MIKKPHKHPLNQILPIVSVKASRLLIAQFMFKPRSKHLSNNGSFVALSSLQHSHKEIVTIGKQKIFV